MATVIELDPTEPTIDGKYSHADRVLIKCDATNGAFTVTLPDATSVEGTVFKIIKTDSTANVVTVDTVDNQTINSLTSIALSAQGDAAGLDSDNSNWLRTGKN